MRGWGPRARALVRRALHALLPDDDWSREFVEALDEEARKRCARSGETVATLWYLAHALSPSTLHFVLRVRVRARPRAGLGPRSGLVGQLSLDLRHAIRSLRRDTGTTVFISATLAVGIGSVTAVHGVADRLFLSGPPHVSDSHEIVRVFLSAPAESGRRASPWLP